MESNKGRHLVSFPSIYSYVRREAHVSILKCAYPKREINKIVSSLVLYFSIIPTHSYHSCLLFILVIIVYNTHD